ncbi:addiction module protein [Lunatibacter salilacus]|uniref:addiction module protein n=1 Tax=Lunatibacter salilacus TaxID=2483804 RepID=UPI00131AE0BE|nr:addiction module protein [Lunatibacter salilacus]
METILKDILKLSVAERIFLVEAIWDTLPEETEIEFTEAQKKEIDRRLDLYEKGETKTYSWEEVKQSLKLSK